jgi:hypothetical protein
MASYLYSGRQKRQPAWTNALSPVDAEDTPLDRVYIRSHRQKKKGLG